MDVIRKFEPLFGDWYVESFIGAGSFGRVYKIYREELGRRFYSALKYISIPAEEGEIRQLRMEGMDKNSISGYYDDLAQNVYTEISMMDNLKGHTNIVSFADSRILPKPTGIGYDIFIRMELLESLSGRMIGDPLTTEEIAELGKDVCSALILCKRKGIIHRDIKPDNIFISSNGDYKLGDFGVARQLEKTVTFMSKKGTPNYMAPEVYKGEEYGATCDIYSLGLVMYHLLNGKPPFYPTTTGSILPEDREQAIVRRMRGEPFDPPVRGGKSLWTIIQKACAYDPKDRYASAAEMKQALERITDFADEPIKPEIAPGDRTVAVFGSQDNEPLPGWKIVRTIGKGDVGRVYEVNKKGKSSTLMIIRIPETDAEMRAYRNEGYDDARLKELFQDCAENITARVDSMGKLDGDSHIVRCEEHSIEQHRDDPGCDVFIRMELLTSLPDSIFRGFPNRVVPDATVMKVGADICRALECLEREHIAHRDIKPHNIFVNDSGDYKLGGFGIAKEGTYGYAAPEIYWGMPYSTSTDLYSLGMVLYWMLNECREPILPSQPAGEAYGADADILKSKWQGETLPAPKHGSEALKRIVLKACAFNSKDRYTSAGEMKKALDRVTDLADASIEKQRTKAVRTQPNNERTISLFNHTPDVREQSGKDATIGLFTTTPGNAKTAQGTVGQTKPAVPQNGVFCPYCGRSQKPGSGFCTICGKPLYAQRKQENVTAQPPEEKPKKKNRAIYWIIPALLLLTAVVVLVVVLAGKGKPAQQAEAQPTATPSLTPEPEAWGIEGNWSWSLSDGVLTISGEGNIKEYDRNGSPWYENQESIKQVVIEDGITGIGSCAFLNCSNLTGITIPDSVTSIGDGAFFGCSSLKSITIPSSVTSIGDGAFDGCSSLTSITIPSSVTSIGDDAFCDCSSLTSITIPDGVTSIGNYAFYGCSSLNSITIPSSVTSIDDGAFKSCSSLTSITIPDSVTSIRDYAFDGCSSLTDVTIPDSVTSIGFGAFSGCSSLSSITIPDSVTSIGNYAFDGCSSLTDVTIPDSVTSIVNYAFYGCSSLTDVTIPDSVTSIGDHAFCFCSSLTSVTIPSSVTSIGFGAFSGCSNLSSITIPSSVTSIGNYAFYGCSSLTSITIPSSVTSIGFGAFSGCSSLSSVTIPDSVTSIGNHAFDGCSSLKDVYFKGSEAQWKAISIGYDNNPLQNAAIHYNSN